MSDPTSRPFMPAIGSHVWEISGLDVALLSQHARLVTLTVPEAAKVANDSIVVERFTGLEAVNTLFTFTIDVLATSGAFDPVQLIGEELTLRLLLADGSTRAWHGQLIGVDVLGGDGGIERYRFHLQPWLAQLDLRRDSFVYAQKNVRDIVSEVFADYPLANYSFSVLRELPELATCTQYRESDLAFVRRLLAQAGLSFRFEHEQTERSSTSTEVSPSRHRLVIFDTHAKLPDCPLDPIRFHGVRATETRDSITLWSARRQMAPNSVTRSAWRTDTLHAPAGQSATNLDLGDIPVLEHHDGAGAQRYATGDAAHQAAEAFLLAHESRIKRYQGQGSVRVLAPGQRFKLSQHDRYGVDGDGQEFTCLAVRHEAANNLGTQAADILEATDIEKGTYRNSFEAHPGDASIAPLSIPKPTAPDSMIAIVVGSDDDDPNTAVHTRRDHQVQVRFAWQARRQSEADYQRQYNRQGTLVQAGRHVSTAASVWVPVATSLAGPNWGHHHLPRKDTEVLLTFIEGDIDRPIVAHQLFNAQDLPPWSAGEGSGANHPGVLSGWHSRSLDGSGFNQWMADDAPGQVRTRLATSHAASQLNLGHLNAQAPEVASRGNWRGTGAELRSDAWVAVRAGEGFLISTVAQDRAQGTTQDTTSARGQLEAAKQAAERLSDAASGAEALALKANDRLQPLLGDLDPDKNGHYPDTVNGQGAKSPEGGGVDSREGKHPVPAFARPLMVLDANTSLNLATPASATFFAGDAIHWTAQQQAHLAAGKTVSLAAAKSVGLFAAEGGIQVIAQDGPVSVQAHTGELEWLSKEGFTVTSSNDELHILAKEKITFEGGQTSITLDGANIVLKMPALLDVKGTSKAFVGPKGTATELWTLPSSSLTVQLSSFIQKENFSVQFVLKSETGKPLANFPYVISSFEGEQLSGVTDSNGKSCRIYSDQPGVYSIARKTRESNDKETPQGTAREHDEY